jgi:hypothetical protein
MKNAKQTIGEFLEVDIHDDASVDAVIPPTASNRWLDDWARKHPEAADSTAVEFFTSRPMSREDARELLRRSMPDQPGPLDESGACSSTP